MNKVLHLKKKSYNRSMVASFLILPSHFGCYLFNILSCTVNVTNVT